MSCVAKPDLVSVGSSGEVMGPFGAKMCSTYFCTTYPFIYFQIWQEKDTVLELGVEFTEVSLHLCTTVGKHGKTVLVDKRRRDSNTNRCKFCNVEVFVSPSDKLLSNVDMGKKNYRIKSLVFNLYSLNSSWFIQNNYDQ